MKSYIPLLSLLLLGSTVVSCSKHSPRTPESSLEIRTEHRAGSKALEMNNENYTSPSGNEYRVTRMEYLLSDFFLISDRGEKVRFDTVLYVNAAGQDVIEWEGIPSGRYLRAGFTCGLAPERNQRGMHHHRQHMSEMAWPEQMGGGYHFMRFEGHYKDSSEWEGFALHLGKDGNHVEVEKKLDLDLRKKGAKLRVRMDLNGWFDGEGGVYDLHEHPSYSMSHDEAMKHLCENGASAFQIIIGP